MTFLIIRIVYGIYFGGIMFYGLHLLSMLIFSKLRLMVRLSRLAKGALVALAWPIMILSSGGISFLKSNINKF